MPPIPQEGPVTLADLIDDSRSELAVDPETLAEALHAFAECAAACTACSAACLAEDDPAALRECIALDDVCAQICSATTLVASRLTSGSWEVLAAQLAACETAAEACARSCREHAEHHEHCARCAEACDRAARAARTLLDALPSGT